MSQQVEYFKRLGVDTGPQWLVHTLEVGGKMWEFGAVGDLEGAYIDETSGWLVLPASGERFSPDHIKAVGEGL